MKFLIAALLMASCAWGQTPNEPHWVTNSHWHQYLLPDHWECPAGYSQILPDGTIINGDGGSEDHTQVPTCKPAKNAAGEAMHYSVQTATASTALIGDAGPMEGGTNAWTPPAEPIDVPAIRTDAIEFDYIYRPCQDNEASTLGRTCFDYVPHKKTWTCKDKQRILQAAENGKHWCHKPQTVEVKSQPKEDKP